MSERVKKDSAPSICFDLDGTLCTQVDPKNHGVYSSVGETYRDAKPHKERIALVNRLYESGHYIYIDTARATSYPEKLEEWTEMTKKQLKEWGLKYHELRLGVKFGADCYVDDRGVYSEDFFKDE